VPREALAKWDKSDKMLTMYYVYILKLSNNWYYTGYSSNLQKRLKEHQQGRVKATQNHRPVQLLFYCAFISKGKALAFEKYLKTGSGFAFRNKRLV